MECELLLLLVLLVSGGGGAGEWDMGAKEGAKRKCMTDGSPGGYKYSRFRWRAAAVAARRRGDAKNCMRARVGPPEERCLFPFLLFPSSSPAPDPRAFLHSSGGRLVFLLAPSSERFPFLSLYLGAVRVPWHSTRNSLPTSPRPQLANLPAAHVQITYTFIFLMKINSFLFLFFFVVFLGSFTFAFTKTKRPRKQEQLPSNAPAIVSFASYPHTRTPSAAVIPNRAQGALSFILSDLYLALPSISRARVYRPLMLLPTGLLSPPLIRSTFAEITTSRCDLLTSILPSTVYNIHLHGLQTVRTRIHPLLIFQSPAHRLHHALQSELSFTTGYPFLIWNPRLDPLSSRAPQSCAILVPTVCHQASMCSRHLPPCQPLTTNQQPKI